MTYRNVEAWLAEHWDRSAFLVFMRRVEILLLNNLQDTAISAFRQFLAWQRPEPPTLDSAVHDVLPLRIANKLEQAGYDTLRAAYCADKSELLKVGQLGDKAIEVIHIAAEAAQRGRRLPEVVQELAFELKPEFEIDWEYFSQFAPHWDQFLSASQALDPLPKKVPSTMSVSTETNPLSLLLTSIDNPEYTIAQIDSQISLREAELAKLKRLRKLLHVNVAPAKPARSGGSSFVEAEAKICSAVESEPLAPKEISQRTGLDPGHIGRITLRSSKLKRLADGKIAAE